jgi:hypothetical protein
LPKSDEDPDNNGSYWTHRELGSRLLFSNICWRMKVHQIARALTAVLSVGCENNPESQQDRMNQSDANSTGTQLQEHAGKFIGKMPGGDRVNGAHAGMTVAERNPTGSSIGMKANATIRAWQAGWLFKFDRELQPDRVQKCIQAFV